MPAIEVGSVAVSVVPDVKNFAKDLRAKLGPSAGEVGVEIGKQIGAGITKGIGDPLDKPLRDLPAKKRASATKDGEQIGGAFAQGFQRRVQAAFQSLPKARLDADASAADRKIDEIRQRLALLADHTVGIDISDAAAKAKIDTLKAELRKVGASSPSVQVRADVASALGQLAAFDAEVSRLDGRAVNVRASADTGAAVAALQALAIEMAVVGSIPVAASVGAGIAGLVGPLGAATAGFGGLVAAAVPGVSRISKAMQAQDAAQNQVTTSGGHAAKAIRSVAVAQDQARIRALQMSAAQQQVAQAVRQAAQAHSDALARVRDAERGLASAQVAARQAQLNLNAARQQAKLDAQDLSNSVIDAGLAVRSGQLAIEQAQLDLVSQSQKTAQAIAAVGDAKKKLADAQAAAAKINADAGSTDAQKKAATQAVTAAKKQVTAAQQAAKQQNLAQRQAQLAYDQAVQSLKEQRLQLKRLQAQRAASDKAGISGDRNVIAARQQLAEANARVADQERAVAEARRNVAQVDAQSAASVANARRAVLQQQLSAKLASDQAAEAARNAAGATGGASAASLKYAAALAKLTPAERDLMNHFIGLKTAYTDWARALEPDVLPVLSKGLDLVRQQLPALTPLVRGSAAAFLDLENRAGAALSGPFWTQFFAMIAREAPLAITRLGVAAGNTVTGIAGVVQAFLPYGNQLLGWIDSGTAKFSTWGQQLNSSAGFAHFMGYVRESGPAVIAAVSGLAHGVGQLVIALAPAGPPLLEIVGGLGHLIGYIAQVDPGLVRLAALIYGVSRAATLLKIGPLVTGLRGLGGAAAGAATGAVGLGGKLRSLGGWIQGVSGASLTTRTSLMGLGKAAAGLAVIGVAAYAVGKLADSQFGAIQSTQQLSGSLTQLGRTGRFAGPLAEQWRAGALSGKTAFDEFTDAAKQIGDPSLTDYISHGIGQAFSAITGSQSKFDHLKEAMAATDQTLVQMVQSGHADQAKAAYQRMAAAIQKSGGNVGALKKSLPGYSQAIAAMGGKSQLAAGEVNRLTGALGSFYNQTRGDRTSANLAFAQSVKAIGDSFKTNGAKIRGNSLAALSNRDAVSQAARAASDYIAKVYQNAKANKSDAAAQQAAIRAYRSKRTAMINELVQSGLNRKAAKRLVDQYLKVPPKRATQFSAPGATKSRDQVKSLGTAIAHIHGKRVVINANTKGAKTQIGAFYRYFNALDLKRTATIGFRQLGPGKQGVPLGVKADGGITRFANGSERHLAQVARPGEMRLWGEKETGGEAYIPLSPAKRPRSLAILRQVAQEFGFALTPLAAGLIRFAAGGVTKPLANVKAAAKAVPLTVGGNTPAAQMAGLANAATAANVATQDLSTTALPGFTAAARTTVPASNLVAGRLTVLAARTKTQSDRTTVATARLRSLGVQSAGPSSIAASTLTRRTGTLSTAVTRNSTTVSTNTTRLRTGTAATNTLSRATTTHTGRTNADTGAVRSQSGALSTNAARLRKVASDAGVARRAVDKFVDAYKRKPYNISRSITVNAKGKFTMSNFTAGWATGGPVFGAGTATSDSIPARLSNGEHVWTAREVAGAGGHGNVMALRQAAAQGQAPGFAKGGAVSKTRSIAKESVPKFTPDYEAMMARIISAAVKTTAKESAKIIRSLFSGSGSAVVAAAKTQLGVPYSWGGGTKSGPSYGIAQGSNIKGFDCSGLMEYAYWKGAHYNLPGTDATQITHGKPVHSRSRLVPGDIMRPHVGHIYMAATPGARGPHGIIEAPHTGSHVRLTSFRGMAGGARHILSGGSGGSTAGGNHASPGRAQAFARSQLPEFGWSPGYNFGPLKTMWTHESNWRWNARNRSSGAYGIPQSYPATKMASAGRDWRDNAFTQVKWGLGYIKGRYGSPAKAWRFWQSHHSYDSGGYLPPGPSLVYNGTGRPEPVLTDTQWRNVEASTVGGDGAHTEYHAHFDGASRAELRHLTQSEFYRQSVRQSQAARPTRRR